MVSCYLLVSFSVFQKWRILFLRKTFLAPDSGPPGARGSGSINRLNPGILVYATGPFDLIILARLAGLSWTTSVYRLWMARPVFLSKYGHRDRQTH